MSEETKNIDLVPKLKLALLAAFLCAAPVYAVGVVVFGVNAGHCARNMPDDDACAQKVLRITRAFELAIAAAAIGGGVSSWRNNTKTPPKPPQA